jgi:hypothetical protein
MTTVAMVEIFFRRRTGRRSCGLLVLQGVWGVWFERIQQNKSLRATALYMYTPSHVMGTRMYV